MKNKKGQALVEFIIILPVFILLLISAIDYMRIISVKMSLESKMEDLVLDSDTTLEDDIVFNEVTTDGEISYYLRKKIDIYSPFLTIVMDSPYDVEVKRVVYEE